MLCVMSWCPQISDKNNGVYAHREDWTFLGAQAGLCMIPEKMATDAVRSAGRHVIWLKFNN